MSKNALFIVLAAAGIAFAAAAPAAPPSAEGQKLDSGLGNLPHYSQWQDKSGRYPMGYHVAGESLDDGLGDLPHYAQWQDKSGHDPMGRHGQLVAASH